MTEYEKRMNAAMKKFNSCAYSSYGKCGTGRCSLDGYPVLDCPRCTSYKKRKEEGSKE